MRTLQRFVERHLYKLIMLLLTAGFAMLFVELLLDGHTDGVKLIGVFAAVLGLLLGLVALFAQGALRYGLMALFLLLSVSGLVGTYEHYEERGEEAAAPAWIASVPATQRTISLRADETQEGEAEEGTPPPLAPLSLSGLSLMAAVMLLGYKEERVR
jgi:hypothetical protein